MARPRKLSPKQLVEIERLFREGWMTRKEVQYHFHVSKQTLWRRLPPGLKADPKSYDPLPK